MDPPVVDVIVVVEPPVDVAGAVELVIVVVTLIVDVLVVAEVDEDGAEVAVVKGSPHQALGGQNCSTT